MRRSTKQAKTEEKVYDAIDEICDELDLTIPYYPEVYWVGRTGDLNSFGLRSSQVDDSERKRRAGWSEYLKRERGLSCFTEIVSIMLMKNLRILFI
jgi:hypothetical protein